MRSLPGKVALVGGLLAATQVLANTPSFKPIFFDTNSFRLNTDAESKLDGVAAFMKEHSDYQVVLTGSTDPRGTIQVNIALRRQRSNSAKQFLVDHGVPETAIIVRAAEPASGNLPASAYAKLRSVSFRVVSPKEVAAEEKAEEKEEQKEAQAPAKEEKDEKGRPYVDVIYWKSVNHALWILAKQTGLFEQEGLNVRLHESQLEANEIATQLGGSKGGKALFDTKELKDKKFFVGAVCAYGFHDGLAKKLPLVEIGSMVNNMNTMLMKKELLADLKKDLRNFKGHTIARIKDLPTRVDPAFLFTDKLASVGLKEDQDYKVKWYTSWGDTFDAVIKGEVDTAVCLAPMDAEIVEKHPDIGLLYVRELYPFMPCCRQVVTRDNLRKHRDQYIHFERAVIRAHRFYVEHPDESVKILAKFLGIREALVREALVAKGFTLTPDPMFKGAQAFRKTMLSLGQKSIGGDLRESVDTSIYEDALLSLQKENPSDGYFAKMVETYRRAN